MVQFIDDHRDAYGVESICTVVPIAPSTYGTRPATQIPRDGAHGTNATTTREIQRVWDDNQQVYGPRKVWRQLRREGHRVARCTVGRLMRAMSLRGAVRGRAWVTTTQADRVRIVRVTSSTVLRGDPAQSIMGADFTYVATWRGFVYVAFVIDVFARRIVGWRVSTSLRTDFVLDALEQAIYDRRGDGAGDLVHHSDRGTQYLVDALHRAAGRRRHRAVSAVAATRTTTPSPKQSSVVQDGGDQTRPVASHRRGRIVLRHAVVTWLDWFNTRRLLEPTATSRRRSTKSLL